MSSPNFHENAQKFQKWPLFAFFSIFLKNFKNKKNKKYRKKPAIWPRTCIKPRYTNGFIAFFASSKSGHRGHKSGQKHENGHFFEKFHEAFFTNFSPKNAKWPKKPATWPLLWSQTGHEIFIFFHPIFLAKRKRRCDFSPLSYWLYCLFLATILLAKSSPQVGQ